MQLQRLVPILQRFPDRGLPDVVASVRDEMESADWTSAVVPGSRIAIGVGSRGIANIAVITKAVVDFWRSRGVTPFIVPVMGSHGAASAAGQAAVLVRYGITEEAMRVPIVSSLDVVKVGTTPEGIDVSMDRHAYESDGVMLVGRVKWHTGFIGKLESGVHKMMAIGLGKWEGAKRYHVFGLRIGLEQVIRSVGKVILDTGRMLGGLAILEDAYHRTAEVHALGAVGMVEHEERLLERVKQWKARIPAKELDLLIVDEIGKNISGAGMDAKVINRGVVGRNELPDVVKIMRVYARDLTAESGGNAVGIGSCDVISSRLFHKIDFESTWVNALTASHPEVSNCPPHFANDRTAIEKIIVTCGKLEPGECSIAWIRNTMRLDEMLISENLLDEIEGSSEIEAAGPAVDLEYDSAGNLAPVLSKDGGTR
jgi:lactate racemase-like protein